MFDRTVGTATLACILFRGKGFKSALCLLCSGEVHWSINAGHRSRARQYQLRRRTNRFSTHCCESMWSAGLLRCQSYETIYLLSASIPFCSASSGSNNVKMCEPYQLLSPLIQCVWDRECTRSKRMGIDEALAPFPSRPRILVDGCHGLDPASKISRWCVDQRKLSPLRRV